MTDILALIDPVQTFALPLSQPTAAVVVQPSEPHRPDLVRDYGPTLAMFVGFSVICGIFWRIAGYFKAIELGQANTNASMKEIKLELKHAQEMSDIRFKHIEDTGRHTPSHARLTMP